MDITISNFIYIPYPGTSVAKHDAMVCHGEMHAMAAWHASWQASKHMAKPRGNVDVNMSMDIKGKHRGALQRPSVTNHAAWRD